ncbi:MAG: O-antigen ligase family protein [Thermoleophilaceae bacterium]
MRRAIATTENAPWAAGGAALAAASGALAVLAPGALIVTALAALGAAAVIAFPFEALIGLLVLEAAMPSSVILSLFTLAGGGLALLLAAPRLPARRATLPMLGFLIVALPALQLAPTLDEGPKPDGLYLPMVGVRYLPMPSDELLGWLRLAAVLALLALAAWTVRDRRRLDIAVNALLASAVVPILVALHQLATGQLSTRAGFSAVKGPFTHPNYFGYFLMVVLILAVVVFLERPTLATRVPLGLLIAAGGVCLVSTYTRGAWVGFAASLLVLGVLRYPRLFVIGAVGLLVSVFAFPGTVDKVTARFGDLTSQNESASSNSWTWRTGQWGRMVHYGSDHPLSGEGFGTYPRLTVEEFGTSDRTYPTIAAQSEVTRAHRGFTAHNDYVRSFVELGVPGLVLWVGFLGGMLAAGIAAWQRPQVRDIATASIAVSAGLIGVSAADNLMGYAVVLGFAVVLCGAVAGAAFGAGRACTTQAE